MIKKIVAIFCLLSCFSMLFAQNIKYDPAVINKNIGLSLYNEADHSLFLGLKWMISQQETDGSWNHHAAMTALALSAFLRYNSAFSIEDTVIRKGFDFLKKCVRENGGIYQREDMPNYNTAICLMAFKDAGNIEFHQIIMNAENFLIKNQLNEKAGYTKDSLNFGGIGYGDDKSPDLCNLEWAIEALKYEETKNIELLSPEEKEIYRQKMLYFENALVFLSKCQNSKAANSHAKYDDGGFIYSPNESKADNFRSYGSMTYAGLKSMIYMKAGKSDPAVNAAFEWVSKNYTVTENPVMGIQGLYYYYHTMSKSLSAYGCDFISSEGNKPHNWRQELANQIITLQNNEGWWQNSSNRWWENNKILVTSYCILSLEEILKQ